ncbi:hypothetical protein [Streptantibioticus silvisoli]|uniref:Uncharacterized protein n=1 Tax=Streptantibioticus silvisoli TaxID=2705255 RepID=A0ABT6W4V3_9ACTN|nr:hypothetical protein [Streptantibioticus silvisoli]MDI5965786.1 hypothetical protein [Streptantibioticus silvisoli]
MLAIVVSLRLMPLAMTPLWPTRLALSTLLALASANAYAIMNGMDTHALEAAAQRYKKADDALRNAREKLQVEAVAALRSGVKQVEVGRITEWSREYLRRLRDEADKRDAEAEAQAELEALRQRVAELEADPDA